MMGYVISNTARRVRRMDWRWVIAVCSVLVLVLSHNEVSEKLGRFLSTTIYIALVVGTIALFLSILTSVGL